MIRLTAKAVDCHWLHQSTGRLSKVLFEAMRALQSIELACLEVRNSVDSRDDLAMTLIAGIF